MKKIILLISLVFAVITDLSSQVIYNSKIDSIINLVSVQSISRMNKELSGDTTVIVSGVNRKIYSRFWQSPDNARAARYIYEKFLSYGLTPKYMINNMSNNNVYAVKTGIKYPDKKIIIGAHYDDIIHPTFPGIYDTIHGADDNASGVCAVLESARLLANMDLDYTVIFVAFDEEEMGLFGSMAFADSCRARNENIIGVINLDMIGYDANNDSKSKIMTDTNSQFLYNIFAAVVHKYNIGLEPIKELSTGGGSDHYYFWVNGYKAITSIEHDFNAYYHTVRETFDKFNVPYFHKMVKAAVGFLMTLAMDKFVNLELSHYQLSSFSDTTSRVATLKVKSEVKLAGGLNSPRLYYKAGNGNYNFVNSFYNNDDSLLFLIPGFPDGTKVSYYFAVQNSHSDYSCTLPSGGDGLNPPGITPPPIVYEYYVVLNYNNNNCSNSVPVNIRDNVVTADTIHIKEKGYLKTISIALNISHPNDGDLVIALFRPLTGTIALSNLYGEGGQNFINTVFDDTSSIPISQGIPPYSGRYKPIGNLSILYDKDISGDWILKILDKKSGNEGVLNSWCLQMTYNIVGINEPVSEIPKEFKLFQNYPNPFNPATNIKYNIAKSSLVNLKIYDMLGRVVAEPVNEYQKAGVYEVQFPGNTGSNLPSGVYVYKLSAGDFVSVKRMVLVK